MFQVCFTACLAEEGKESRKEYSIYYYARANARASVPCRKSVQKQESRRFSISGKGRKRGKSAGMAGKNTTGGIRKMQKIPEKIGMTGKKYGRHLHKTDRKKCSGNRKIPEWLIKKRQTASAKYKRFRMKNRDDGKKTWQAPAQNRQKKCSGNRKIPEWLIKNGKWHP